MLEDVSKAVCLPLKTFVYFDNLAEHAVLKAGVYLDDHRQRYTGTVVFSPDGKLLCTGLGIESQS